MSPPDPGSRRRGGPDPRVEARSGAEPGRGHPGRACTFSGHGQSPRAHPPGRGLPPVVPGRRQQGRVGRQRSGARHHGHPPVRLCDLGADAGRGRRAHQGHRRGERLLPAVHPRELPAPRGRPRRGLQPRAGRGHPRRRQGARRAGRGPADQRDGHRRVHGQVDPELPRPAAAAQPVGQRRALGAAAPTVPAHERVPLAGGSHRACDVRRRARLRVPHPPRGLRRLHDRGAGHAGGRRAEDGQGAVRRARSTRSRARR